MGLQFEYGLVSFLALFTLLTFFSLSLLGVSQIPYEVDAEPNLLEGLSYFFQNPYVGFWEKFIYTIVIIAPLGSIVTMIGLNYARGRG
jgi:hypothetical protein